MKFTTTIAVLTGLFIGLGIANPVPAAEANAALDAPLERRCAAQYSQYNLGLQDCGTKT